MTLARYLALTPQRVRQLAAQGVLEKVSGGDARQHARFNLLSCVNAYIVFLRDRDRSIDPGETDYQRSRSRRMAALADIEQLRLKRIHGELHHAEDVRFLMTQMITACRQRLLALPSRLCHSLQMKSNPAEIAEILKQEVEAALRELSEYDPAKFEAANEEYLAGIGVAKPADKNGAFHSSGPDVEL